MWQSSLPTWYTPQVTSTVPETTPPESETAVSAWVHSTVACCPASLQLGKVKVPKATTGATPGVAIAAVPVAVAVAPVQFRLTAPTDKTLPLLVAVKLVSLALVHVVAPAAEDSTPNSDTNDTANTAMRMILLIRFPSCDATRRSR
jgi:hypothetical protein